MAWQPLVTGERRAALASIVREIVEALEAMPARAAVDPVTHALLRMYVAEADIVPDLDGAGDAALARAIAGLARGRSPALFGGVAGTAWLVAHAASGDAADSLCAGIDTELLARLASWSGDYDLIEGLVGLGVYALERGEPGHSLAVGVLDQLARSARPRSGGLAWHTAPGLLPPQQRAVAPDGYWDLGLAHGNPGVIAVLARMIASGVAVELAGELLDGAVTALLASEPATANGRYPGWHAGGHDERAAPEPADENRARLAWCYNDLGVSLALMSAAQATSNPGWYSEALVLARACTARSEAQAAVLDSFVCHGAFGAAHLFNRLRHATGDDAFASAAEHWLARGLEMRTDRPLAGFARRLVRDGSERWSPDASLLNGASGIALVLHSMITDVEPGWDRLLLADLAEASSRPTADDHGPVGVSG